jgi:DNA-directed RNA polymerase subunit RPC12/RpoP
MSGPQLLIMSEQDNDYACLACNRRFVDRHGLISHFETPYVHAYRRCRGCTRLFTPELALKQHRDYSKMHVYCGSCVVDVATPSALKSHQWIEDSRCPRCGDKVLSDGKADHFERVHSVYSQCERECGNRNNLEQVRTRLPLDACSEH